MGIREDAAFTRKELEDNACGPYCWVFSVAPSYPQGACTCDRTALLHHLKYLRIFFDLHGGEASTWVSGVESLYPHHGRSPDDPGLPK